MVSISNSDFRTVLFRIGREIGKQDLQWLKFSCRDVLLESKLETINSARDIFIALEEKGLLSKSNIDFLAFRLMDIQRRDLLSHFAAFRFRVPNPLDEPSPTLPIASSPDGTCTCRTPFTKILLDVAMRLREEEVKDLTYTWCQGYLHMSPDNVLNTAQLFTKMSQQLLLDPDNLDLLERDLAELGRHDLTMLIKKYYDDVGLSHSSGFEGNYPNSETTLIATPTMCVPTIGANQHLSYGYSSPLSTPSTCSSGQIGPYPGVGPTCDDIDDKMSVYSTTTNDISDGNKVQMTKPPNEANVKQEKSGIPPTPTLVAPDLECYKMDKTPHGYCVIFSNYKFYQVDKAWPELDERRGAEVDQQNLISAFESLRYSVELYVNLTSEQMFDTMKEIGSRDHSKYDSFSCCILSHGREGEVFGSDSRPINLRDFTAIVKGSYCRSLLNKPKIFVIQACRGDREEKGVKDDPIERDGNSGVPSEVDYFFAYATPPGYAAYRSRRHGSWFISCLCEVLNNHSHSMALGSLIKKVNAKVSDAYTNEGYKQCIEVVDRLRKEIRFFQDIS